MCVRVSAGGGGGGAGGSSDSRQAPLAHSHSSQVKNQSGLVDGLHAGIDKNQSEVTGLTDRTQKLLKKG